MDWLGMPGWRLMGTCVLCCVGVLVGAVGPTATGVGTNLSPVTVEEPPMELVMAGRHVYERQCLVCHGKWGDGRGEMATGMVPRPRRLTSGVFKYRSTPVGYLPTDADLERTIRTGVAGTSMPSFAGLSDREIRAVIGYVKTLSTRWKRAGNYAPEVQLPPVPGWMEDPVARVGHEKRGAELFAGLCAPCHGAGGAGDGPAGAKLEDVWGDPIRPADLRLPLAKSGPGARDLFRTVTLGLDGTPMAGFGDSVPESDRWALVAYIRARKAEHREGR
jgi:cytochrome c oxidase cbb3-type subunit 2